MGAREGREEEWWGRVECSSSSSSSSSGGGGSGSGSNDAIRRVMQNDVTLGAGVTVLSQGQPVQGPAVQPPLNPWRATAPRFSSSSFSSSSPRCSLSVRLFGVGTWELHSQIFRFAHTALSLSLVSSCSFYSSNLYALGYLSRTLRI